ncbi:MAG: MmcQ/YjbR family DNA-binding protein [Bacteroidetes bacterium]|nr:MAG: MmcQ/YjbR family DNA-binding protein [Bacteroidota bacterium]
MTLGAFHDFCTALPHTTAEFPFGPTAMVFKVCGKMFALADAEQFESVNLKCLPDVALELRAQYPSVLPGYHMNKQQWNTVLMDGSISAKLLREWTLTSYKLVVNKLPLRDKIPLIAAMDALEKEQEKP